MARKRKKKKKEAKKVMGCTKIETTVKKLLDELQIPHQHNVKIDKYSVDFLLKNRKMIIEVYGDFWHANPRYYEPEYYNKALKCSAQEKWSKDATRQHKLEEMGYTFHILWETEIKKSPSKTLKSIIKSFITSS